MNKLIWTLKLCFWLKYYGYCKTFKLVWDFANDDCWQCYRKYYSPKEAVLEDLSY